jgi:hypothetical protein
MAAHRPLRQLRGQPAPRLRLPGLRSTNMTPWPADLRELPDPEFITLWASLRTRLALTPAGSPGHPELKTRYDAAKAEYQRRINGGLATRGTASQ